MANMKHFYRDLLLARIEPMANQAFALAFPGVKGWRCDSFSRYVGFTEDKRGPFPVERIIEYKSQPSLHECNARCLNGKCNGVCECQCGGRNHGLGAILEAAGLT